ncbi:MAG: sugar porter family MFS transporter [Bacteroidota bacterium]
MTNSPKKQDIILITIIVALGGFLLGFDASVISGVVKFIEPEFNLSKIELGWAVSSITLTAALGTLIAGPLSDNLGRKRLLTYAAILFTVSAIGSALAPTFFWLIVARLIGGLAVGVALIIAPVYIAEVAPPRYRGLLVSFNQLNIVIGISIAFFTNYLILQLGQSDMTWTQALGLERWNWRWMLGLETLPALFYFLGLFFVPRSPRWLMMKNREDEARRIMMRFNAEAGIARQMEEVRISLEENKNRNKASFRELFAPELRLVMTVGLVVAIFQQATGINSVLFYAPMIFEQTGIGTDASFVQAILVGLTNLVATVVAMATIDKLGRKPLLTIGMAGMAVCLFLLTFGFYSATYTITEKTLNDLPESIEVSSLTALQGQAFDSEIEFRQALTEVLGEATIAESGTTLVNTSIILNTQIILLGILGFVAAYAASIGPVMWVLFSELFPNRIRGIAISFVGLINLGVAFGVQLLFPWELESLGSGTTFLIYASLAVVGLIFIMAKVPETKGKTLEELEAQLVK